MRAQYATASIIRAEPQAVWNVLTDAAGYAAWNPEIVGIEGAFAEGSRIRARVRLGSGALRTVPMRVSQFKPPSSMVWTGGLPLGLFVGRRAYTVSPHPMGTEFRLQLDMSGLVAPLILRSVGDRQPEIDAFADALRRRTEAGPDSGSVSRASETS
jgi:hypothetical protein